MTNTTSSARQEAIDRYWRRTLALTGVLLAIWALAGIGGGILFADALNRFSLGGVPFGFWMAQQGSILVFVALILVYALAMGALERKFRRELGEVTK